MKWWNRPDGETMKQRALIFLWITVCNVAVQLLHPVLEQLGIPSWTIFLANVLFFIMENPNMKERFLQSVFGGIFGLLCAVGLVIVKTRLTALGMAALPATLIPVILALFFTLFLHPVCPVVFNNIALAFFTVGLISAGEVYYHLPGHIAGLLLGNGIVNVGIILLVRWYARRRAASRAEKYG